MPQEGCRGRGLREAFIHQLQARAYAADQPLGRGTLNSEDVEKVRVMGYTWGCFVLVLGAGLPPGGGAGEGGKGWAGEGGWAKRYLGLQGPLIIVTETLGYRSAAG